MFKHFAAALVLGLVSTQASASYYLDCQFDATVKTVDALDKLNGTVSTGDEIRRVGAIQIDAARTIAGHGGCEHFVGRTVILELDAQTLLSEGQTLKLDYHTMNGLTPDGVWSTTTWTVVE